MALQKFIYMLLILSLFQTCNSKHKPLEVVESVNLESYQGTWYEIARLPNRFEKGLKCVTAHYELEKNGKITVINKGHKTASPGVIESVRGTAKVPNKAEPGKLKVTFFWPFYGKYWIIDLDKNYQYALVGSPSRKYLWVLSRNREMGDKTFQRLKKIAQEQGFDVSRLIQTPHNCHVE